MEDDPTGPLVISVGNAARSRSVADQIVAALAPTLPAAAPHRHPMRHLRLRTLLIVLSTGTVAASIAIAFHLGGAGVGATDNALTIHSGDCLTWPDGTPDDASVVDCAGDHLFEVAEPIDIDGFAEQPGLDADRQLEQAFTRACPPAASRYLGDRLDPGGRFIVGMLWSPFGPRQGSGGRLVCGLQLRSDGSASKPFRGRIADQDQSNLWPAGTCLGIEKGQSTDIPVDCGAAHAMEVVGSANLAATFADSAPSTAAQDVAVRDVCNTRTADYLAPRSLADTALSLRYTPISDAGWAAGSRSIACRLGSMKPDGSWATLLGSAKSEVLIDGVAPAPVTAPPAVVPAETIVRAAVPDSPQTEPPVAEEPLPQVVASEAPPEPPPPAEDPLPGPPPDQQNG